MAFWSISLVLGILANHALAGCLVSTPRNPCPPPVPNSPWLNSCPKGMPKQWACLDPKIEFPTVECIVADLKACGTLDKNPLLLYSFGATTVEVRTKVRDTMDPRPVMFNDALPLDWDQKIMGEERFGLKQGKIADPDVNKRNDAFVQRFSAALAVAAKGDVMVVTRSRESKYGGSGAYSKPNPADSKENVWRTYELPLAQRNEDVGRIVSFALDEDPIKPVVDYERGKKGEIMPMPTFPDPPLRKVAAPISPLGPIAGPSNSDPRPKNPPADPKKPLPGGRRPFAVRGQGYILAR